MIFWALVATLVAGVTLAITRPLMRARQDLAGTADADIAVYKDQLKEIDSDAARGALGREEAESARAEIARRLIRSAELQDPPVSTTSVSRDRFVRPAYIVTSVALPVLSLALYLSYGRPGLPGDPLSDRLAAANTSSRPEDLVAKVEARLRDHPDEGQGWDVIAPVYVSMGRFVDAADAYAKAIRLIGETPARLQGFVNARIRAENGIVSDDARKALERILVIAPDRKEPRLWLALAKEQDGRLAEAEADYRKLLADAPPDAPWRVAVEERLASLTKPATPPAAPNAAGDPSAVAAMSPEERQAFIGRMVDGLASRLKADGKDAAGWEKLIRAYQVLGRRDDALKALADARSGLKGDQVGLARVEDLARQLGLGS